MFYEKWPLNSARYAVQTSFFTAIMIVINEKPKKKKKENTEMKQIKWSNQQPKLD